VLWKLILRHRKEKGISKYKNTKNLKKGLHLFGLHQARESIIIKNAVFVVEGQFDCIKAQVSGIKNVVAVGSSDLTAEQFALLNRYTNNIFVLFDNDEAGNVGANKIINHYGDKANIKKATVPLGFKDLFEFLDSGESMSEEFLRLMN
jgi:DNA primase